MKDGFIGIDPGLTGCAVLLSEKRIEFYDFVDAADAVRQLEEWLMKFKVLGAMLENPNVRVTPQKNKHDPDAPARLVSSKFIKNIGMWEGILAALYIKHRLIAPQSWQAKMVPKMPDIKDTKKRSLITAREMFPAAERLLNQRQYNNRADALLIAAYCRREYSKPAQLPIGG